MLSPPIGMIPETSSLPSAWLFLSGTHSLFRYDRSPFFRSCVISSFPACPINCHWDCGVNTRIALFFNSKIRSVARKKTDSLNISKSGKILDFDIGYHAVTIKISWSDNLSFIQEHSDLIEIKAGSIIWRNIRD